MKINHLRAITLCAIFSSPIVHADIVKDWNNAALNAIRLDKTAPPKASKALAMTHLALYDAVNSVTLTHEAYLGYQPVTGPTSIEAAAASAAHRVLVDLYPTQRATFDALLTTQLSTVTNLTERTNGITLGTNAANAMITSRVGDGSAAVATYTNPAPGTIGVYSNTAVPAALPQWGNVTPFAMDSSSQFRAPAPPDINSGFYTASYNEVKSLGANNSTTRTADQTHIAYFWADGEGTATPPGHWNVVAQQVSTQQGLDLVQDARLFALLNMATADAAISAWDTKYEYDMWRPITGIRNDDGNASTVADASWTPLINTPNHPSYTSGHSTFSAASGGVLAEYFGTDLITFNVVSEDITNLPPGYTREFESFSEAVDEAGMSRIYGGIHWQFDNESGKESGYAIAEHVTGNYLRAIPEPSSGLLILFSGTLVLMRRRRA